MNHWMFNCKEVTQIVSESLDRKLPLYQRMGIRFHLSMCRFCSRFRKQLLILRRMMRFQDRFIEDEKHPITLDIKARERIKRSLIDRL
jgi:hypothetical protein